ncbi:MAG TPA: DUF1501 domain-containing protein [Vicinamibacterales bacterium]|jgi:uncharacterized protein (DUF1501 family)
MISRRVFVKDGALALVSLGFAPSFLARTAFAAGTSVRSKRLIAIFQRGALDGLSVVVPFGEADYYRLRPSIAIPRPGTGSAEAALDLDGFFGLNPRLAPLKKFWDARELAIVHACGSPDATRSHFDAQDYMESGTPGIKSTSDGWLNRYLQARQEADATLFRAVSLTSQLPRMLQGTAPALAFNQIAQFGVRNNGEAFEAAYAGSSDKVMSGTAHEAFEAIRMLRAADPGKYQPENGADYPRSPFGQALKQIAQLTKSDLGLEVAFADVGGWDTHVNQGATQGQLANRLDDFGRAIGALVTDLGERMADTIVLTMSEFGRAVHENGNRGTDHGHGNVMLVIGGGVRGGKVYGRWPGLSADRRYDGRDLAITTDFRDVFAELVVRHLGLPDARPVFPGYAASPARFPGMLG